MAKTPDQWKEEDSEQFRRVVERERRDRNRLLRKQLASKDKDRQLISTTR